MLSPLEELQWRTKGYTTSHCINLNVDNVTFDVKNHYKNKRIHNDFGDDPELMFPSRRYKSLNKISLNKKLLSSAQQLLDGPVRLIQSVAWAKKHSNTYEQSNSDQRHHMDYGNNSFVHPPSWNNPNVVSCILYLSDTDETGGATAIVPRNGNKDEWYKPPYIKMPGQSIYPFINDRKKAESMMNSLGCDRSELYDREVKIKMQKGDVLWYRHDVWHRGTPVKKGSVRYVINLAYAKPNAPINVWNSGFSQKMYYGWLEDYISSLNNYQLFAIGFPHPLDAYWTNETIEYTSVRYKLDMKGYVMNSML